MPCRSASNCDTDIYFVGDTHGETRGVCQRIASSIPRPGSAVIFLGDLCLSEPFDDATRPLQDMGLTAYWIAGNHDADTAEYWRNLSSSPASIHGRIVEIGGMKIAGLGGVFRQEIWEPGVCENFADYESYLATAKAKRPKRLREKITQKDIRHQTSIFPAVYESLATQSADILVCHEGVSSIQGGFTAIDFLATRMGVQKVFFGHHHMTRHFPSAIFPHHSYCVGQADYVALQSLQNSDV